MQIKNTFRTIFIQNSCQEMQSRFGPDSFPKFEIEIEISTKSGCCYSVISGFPFLSLESSQFAILDQCMLIYYLRSEHLSQLRHWLDLTM